MHAGFAARLRYQMEEQDHVGLYGYGPNVASQVLQNAVVSGGSTNITVPDNIRITWSNASHQTADDFIAG